MTHIYLTGYTDPYVMRSKATRGVLITPWTSYYASDICRRSHDIAGIDNGCFSEAGRKLYSHELYQDVIARALSFWGPRRIHFATVCDVPMDWKATLEKYVECHGVVKGVKKAICLQDGATSETVPWDIVDVLFIGGSTEWKVSEAAKRLVKEGKGRGKTAHMGRVNSAYRIGIAAEFGCLTSDGTYLMHEHIKGNLYNATREVRSWSR